MFNELDDDAFKIIAESLDTLLNDNPLKNSIGSLKNVSEVCDPNNIFSAYEVKAAVILAEPLHKELKAIIRKLIEAGIYSNKVEVDYNKPSSYSGALYGVAPTIAHLYLKQFGISSTVEVGCFRKPVESGKLTELVKLVLSASQEVSGKSNPVYDVKNHTALILQLESTKSESATEWVIAPCQSTIEAGIDYTHSRFSDFYGESEESLVEVFKVTYGKDGSAERPEDLQGYRPWFDPIRRVNCREGCHIILTGELKKSEIKKVISFSEKLK
ncbi:hypothetical protein KY347_07135 [Candidatus Woesearchaeota archaeon]|nr:hypothetical protein [Candidatus Woesearchaeota archaeon]